MHSCDRVEAGAADRNCRTWRRWTAGQAERVSARSVSDVGASAIWLMRRNCGLTNPNSPWNMQRIVCLFSLARAHARTRHETDTHKADTKAHTRARRPASASKQGGDHPPTHPPTRDAAHAGTEFSEFSERLQFGKKALWTRTASRRVSAWHFTGPVTRNGNRKSCVEERL